MIAVRLDPLCRKIVASSSGVAVTRSLSTVMGRRESSGAELRLSSTMCHPSLLGQVCRPSPPRRSFSGFNFVGPKNLDNILDTEACKDLPGNEIAVLWKEFHEDKKDCLGWVMEGEIGKAVLDTARDKNGKFFIVPIFETPTTNDDGANGQSDCYGTTPQNAGYFNLIVQFFPDNHFVLAPLDKYQSNPAEAQPVLSFSVFDDYIESKNMCLVRADIVAKAFDVKDAQKVISMTLKSWEGKGDTHFVDLFNNKSEEFEFEQYIEEARKQWVRVCDLPSEELGAEFGVVSNTIYVTSFACRLSRHSSGSYKPK